MSVMLSSGPDRIRNAALRAFAVATAALTVGGRYHELNWIADRGLAAFARGKLFVRRDGAHAPSATEAWETARQAAPDLAICHARLASVLRKSGAFDQAREVLSEALARFPNHLGTLIEAARLAERVADHAETSRYWGRVIAMPRPRAVWLAGAAQELILLGRVGEAETLLARARADHPRDPNLLVAECTLAARKQDWSKAVALSRDLRRRFPNYANGPDLLGESIYAETLSKIDEMVNEPVVTQTTQAKLGRVKNEEVGRLLLRFESIGDNCEFGLVQRRYGVEPLGLLRWNRLDADALIAALDYRLEGIGEPEHTDLIVTKAGEYFVMDRRFFLGMHTFLFADQTTHEELYPAMLRRAAALKERFVRDLAAGTKTFVFLSPGLSRETLLDLHRALCTFGPVRLLAVQPARADPPAAFSGRPGDVTTVVPGCYVGFLRRRGVAADQTWNIAFDDWIAVCRKAEALAARERSAAPHPQTA